MSINDDFKSWRDERQLLTDRLVLEYGGAVPPGQVLAAVLRADRLLGRCEAGPERSSLCELLARRQLVDGAARRLRLLVG